jgi:hypothetical protein
MWLVIPIGYLVDVKEMERKRKREWDRCAWQNQCLFSMVGGEHLEDLSISMEVLSCGMEG